MMLKALLAGVSLGASILAVIRARKTPLADIEEEIYAGGPSGPGAPGFGGFGVGPMGPGTHSGGPFPAHPGGPGGQGPFTVTPGPATGGSIYPVANPGQFAYYKAPVVGW